MDADGVEGGAVGGSMGVSTTSPRTVAVRSDAHTCVDSNDVFVCGCCFVWEVTRGPHAGSRVEFSTRDNSLSTTLLRIGRHAQCWLRLKKDLEVSGLHAELRVERGDALKLVLRDDKSTNGTKINGVTAEKRVEYELKHEDLLLFGRSAVRVSRGNTRCAEARRSASQETKQEPTEEPEPPRSNSSSAEEDGTERQVVQRVESDIEDERAVVREQHGDEHVFEEPAPVPVVHAPASSLPSECMVCGQELSAWSVLEQQLHVNACLDQSSGAADPAAQVVAAMTRPSSASRNAQGKKRKRQQTTLSTQPQDEELAVALALSKSLVGKEQQVAMDMALVSSELAQVDAQLAKLQKKRVALVKKLEKLEKAKRKIHTGDVRSPEEIKALLDLSFAFRVMFPEPRRARATGPERTVEERTPRDSIRRLMELYRGEQATMAVMSSEVYVTMWVRASQGSWENESELFTNQLTRELLARAESMTNDKMKSDEDAVDQTLAVAHQQQRVEPERVTTTVPDVVKRVFPKWEENLMFLATQNVEDLRCALDELRQTRVERKMEKALGQEYSEQNDTDLEIQDNGSGINARSDDGASDEEELACAFFEHEMLRLIDEKEREQTPEQLEVDCGESDRRDVEIVELMDSEDDVDADLDDRRSDEYEGETAEMDPETIAIVSTEEKQLEDKSEESPLSSDEDVDVASRENSPLLQETEALLASNAESSGVTPADQERESDERPEVLLDTLEESSTCPSSPQLPSTTSATADESLETKLLDALKANASLYEAVLLLQPLDLQLFLNYVRMDAGIKCAKTELVRFCDRHGITFKQS